MKIIKIIGADSSGKDTQIQLLKNYYSNLGKSVQVISVWDTLVDFLKVTDKETLKKVISVFLLDFNYLARSHFIFSCLNNSFSKINRENEIIILNGFNEKYMASEIVYGCNEEVWNTNATHFISEKTIYLKTSVEVCLDRRSEWSNYEQGLARSAHGKSFTLKEFQFQIHKNLDLITSNDKSVITIDGDEAIEVVHHKILEKL